jgi:PilZ domain
MKYDRRKAERIEVNLPARWEGVIEHGEATVTSLSLNGCFVLSGGRVQPRELLRLEIYLPWDDPVYVWGEVVDEAYEIGFAARFTSPSDDQDQQRLMRFIENEMKSARRD